jgi:PAS domain S-box-containing protein
MRLTTTQKIALGVGMACGGAVAIATLGVYGTRRFVAASGLVAHTHAVRSELRSVMMYVDGAKGDIRGFLLTGDSAYLLRHTNDIAEMRSSFDRAQSLTTDNPAQHQRLTRVGEMLAEREVALQQTIALGYVRSASPDVLARRLGIGETLSRSIHGMLDAADSVEAELLVERTTNEAASERFVLTASVALLIAAVACGLVIWRSIHRDLTGRQLAEEQLRASEAKFAGILEIAADAVISIDESEAIVQFNHGAENIFGFDRSEVMGKPLEVLLPARHEHAHASHLHAFAASPETSRRMGDRRPIHGRRKNGEEFPAEASISKLRTSRGWLFTAVLRDVGERVRQEQNEHALVTASTDLARTLDYEGTLSVVAGLPVPVVGMWSVLVNADEDESGGIVLRRIAGRHPDRDLDAALREWEQLPIDADSPEPFVDVLRTGDVQRYDGVSDEWLEAHVSDASQVGLWQRMGVYSMLFVPLRVGDRTLAAWAIGSSAEHHFDEHDELLARALADRAAMAIESARLFRRAQNATSARDTVLGVVSHDLRNPLAAVSMLARRIVDNPLSDEERRATGVNILTSVDWMFRLMQDLLDSASIEAGRLSVSVEPDSIDSILEVVAEMFREQASARGIRFVVDAAAAPTVLADRSRMVQALGNLVGNALKFTPSDGSVTISSRLQHQEVVVSVADTGPGIPPSDLPRVFDRFWHARRGADHHGNGLGLSIAEGIMRAHNGRIWVESAVGMGTTFFVALPVARASSVQRRSTPARAAQYRT